MRDDLIDFPVSDLWREQYAAQGLTYPSGTYPKTSAARQAQDEEIRGLKSMMQTLRDHLAEVTLTAQHPHLRERAESRPSRPTTFDE